MTARATSAVRISWPFHTYNCGVKVALKGLKSPGVDRRYVTQLRLRLYPPNGRP